MYIYIYIHRYVYISLVLGLMYYYGKFPDTESFPKFDPSQIDTCLATNVGNHLGAVDILSLIYMYRYIIVSLIYICRYVVVYLIYMYRYIIV